MNQSKSQRLIDLQKIFTESHCLAYVGLVYTIAAQYKTESKKAMSAYEKWSQEIIHRLAVYLDLPKQELDMIQRLAEHFIKPCDLALTLIANAKENAEKSLAMEEEYRIKEREAMEQELPLPEPPEALPDIRVTILCHFFLINIAGGQYDARARAMLHSMGTFLKIPWRDVIRIESATAEQLKLMEDAEELKKNDMTVEERNKIEGKHRWIAAAAATLAGGAVIGLTAGLAAPLIGAGIGAALSTVGLTGAAGVGTFMGSTAGLAIITTGGVLTGGGMSGAKMLKRTEGITEFEFVPIKEGLEQVRENRLEKRRNRRKRWKLEVTNAHQQDSEKKDEFLTVNTKMGACMESNHIRTSVLSDVYDSQSVSKFSFPPSVVEEEEEDSSMEQMRFKEMHQRKTKQPHVLITVAGWIAHGKEDYTLPFSTLEPDVHGDHYVLKWESEDLKLLGGTLATFAGEVASFLVTQGLQATILPLLMAGLSGPLWALKLTYLLDNPWGNALTKAKKAGKVLADMLIAQVQEHRPVTLVGFSLGARVIFYCLLELGKRGAYHIVEEAYLFGCPVIPSKEEWDYVTAAVAGRLVNGYLENDWVLGVLYRASQAYWSGIAGLNPVENVPGIENVKLNDVIKGHLEYRIKMPKILERVGFYMAADRFVDEDEEEERHRKELTEELAKIKAEKAKQREERAKTSKSLSNRLSTWFGNANEENNSLDIKVTQELPEEYPVEELTKQLHLNSAHCYSSGSAITTPERAFVRTPN